MRILGLFLLYAAVVMSSTDVTFASSALSTGTPLPQTKIYFLRSAHRLDFEEDYAEYLSGVPRHFDPSLSEKGIKQARRAGAFISRDGGVHKVLASPFLRTLQTAQNAAYFVDNVYEVFPEQGLAELLSPALYPNVKSTDELWSDPRLVSSVLEWIKDQYKSIGHPTFPETLRLVRVSMISLPQDFHCVRYS